MSLDLWMVCDSCGHSHGDFNYTWNCAPMWYAARADDKDMIPIEGMTGEESIPILTNGLDNLKKDPESFKKLNPPNGWGGYDSFVDFVESLLAFARENPKMKWKASR